MQISKTNIIFSENEQKPNFISLNGSLKIINIIIEEISLIRTSFLSIEGSFSNATIKFGFILGVSNDLAPLILCNEAYFLNIYQVSFERIVSGFFFLLFDKDSFLDSLFAIKAASLTLSFIIVRNSSIKCCIQVKNSEKVSLFHIKFISMGLYNKSINEKNSQNCISLENFLKIQIFGCSIINSLGYNIPLGIIAVNSEISMDNYVVFFYN